MMLYEDDTIKGLECCMVNTSDDPDCEHCGYRHDKDTCQNLNELHEDALELIRPHVLPDLKSIEQGDIVWLEVRGNDEEPSYLTEIASFYQAQGVLGHTFYSFAVFERKTIGFAILQFREGAYLNGWRLWNKKPTKERRSKTLWGGVRFGA